MKLKVAISTIFILFSVTAQSAITASFDRRQTMDDTQDIPHAEIYSITGADQTTVPSMIADEIGKRIRQNYYRRYTDVYSFGRHASSLDEAKADLAFASGSFEGLDSNSLSAIDSWASEHNASSVVLLTLEISQMGGTGLERIYLFIPNGAAQSALAVRKFWYAE